MNRTPQSSPTAEPTSRIRKEQMVCFTSIISVHLYICETSSSSTGVYKYSSTGMTKSPRKSCGEERGRRQSQLTCTLNIRMSRCNLQRRQLMGLDGVKWCVSDTTGFSCTTLVMQYIFIIQKYSNCIQPLLCFQSRTFRLQ